jgi:hypothetical protein
MQNSKGCALLFLILCSLILSCNSPRRQKKINDGKLYEKLKEPKGYLNAEELQRLQLDFSLNALDKYDLSGFDEEDTIASFVKSGEYLWIASCYIGEEASPFFCLKEETDRSFKLIRKGVVPALYGEYAYDLEKLLIPVGKYILVSQRTSGSAYCEDNPLVFQADGKPIKRLGRLQLILNNCPFEGTQICCKRDFTYNFQKPFLIIHAHENRVDWETERSIGTVDFDLRFLLQDKSIKFQDTVYKY